MFLSLDLLVLLVWDGVGVRAGPLLLLQVWGQQACLRLNQSSQWVAIKSRLCQLRLQRLRHLSEVVVGAAHNPRVGKDRGGGGIVSREVKIILDQYGPRWCLVEGHLWVRDPLQVVWVGARGQGGGQAARAQYPGHGVATSRIQGVLQTTQGGVFWTQEKTFYFFQKKMKTA